MEARDVVARIVAGVAVVAMAVLSGVLLSGMMVPGPGPAPEGTVASEQGATEVVTPDEVGTDDGLEFRVVRVEPVRAARLADGRILRTTPSTTLVRAQVRYKNATEDPVDAFCGGVGAALLIHTGRAIPAVADAPAAGDVCRRPAIPGGRSRATLLFEAPAGAAVVGLRLWNPESDDSEGETAVVAKL